MTLIEHYNLLEATTEAKTKLFITRTKKHIKLVQKYAKKIESTIDGLDGLVTQTENHDAIKFEEPEFSQYVEINWFYDQKRRGIDVEYDSSLNDATLHHVKNSSHHPEYHDPSANAKAINADDRDKPSGYIVDGTKMPMIDMAEMCADWCAMSEELGGHPIKWCDDNIGARWKFNEEQKTFIYDVINRVW